MTELTTQSIDIHVGRRLKQQRGKLGHTQQELGEKVALSPQLIQQYESGSTRIPASNLYQLSVVLGVSPNYFYEGIVHDQVSHLPSDSDIITRKSVRPLEILLIEDNAADEVLARKALEAGTVKVNVRTVSDGIAALSYLRKHPGYDYAEPDIVMLDLNIPKKNGLDVLKDIRSDQALKHLPVVMLSNSVNAKEMHQCYMRGCSGYIHKSFDYQQFKKDIAMMAEYWANTVALATRF